MRVRAVCLISWVVLLVVATPLAAQQAVFLVRHAEKADQSDDPPLSEAGQARARALAALLRDAGVSAIYATQYQRTAKTAEPLAQALKLPVNVMPSGESGKLVDTLRSRHSQGVVLVVGHTGSVPEVLALFGYRTKVVIPESDYDNLFVLVPTAAGEPTVLRLRY